MAISIDQLLGEADKLIEKKAQKNVPSFSKDDDVMKLASLLLQEDDELSRGMGKEAHVAPKTVLEETMVEKVAHAYAIVYALQNDDKLNKIAEFEKKAQDAGHSESEIAEFIDKNFA